MILNYADIWRPQRRTSAITYDLFLILAGSLLIAMTAQLSFTIGPVPVTGQTFGVLIVGALLGWRRGGTAVLLYLFEGGVLNLPVFAGGTFGFQTFFGPTGGYLISFLPAAMLVGWLAEKGWDRHILSTVMAMIAGNVVIYLFGVPWLRTVLAVSWQDAFSFGLTPFLLGDLFKVMLAALLLPLVWNLMGTRKQPT